MTAPEGSDPNAGQQAGIGEEEEVDWKARAEELEQKNTVLEKDANDARSQRIGALKQSDRDELGIATNTRVSSIEHRIGGMEKGLELLVEATLNPNTDVGERFQKVKQDTQQSLSDMDWTSFYNSQAEAFITLVQDDDGNRLFDIEDDPVLSGVRQEWLNAKDRQDRAGINGALSSLKDVVYQKKLEILRSSGAANTNGNNQETEEDQSESEGDPFSTMDTGNTSGGGGVFSSANQVREAYIRGRIDTKRRDEEMKRFNP